MTGSAFLLQYVTSCPFLLALSYTQWHHFYTTQYLFSFIKTPMFIANSLYDTAQLAAILQLGCLPPHCPEDKMKFFNNFRTVRLYIWCFQLCINFVQNEVWCTSFPLAIPGSVISSPGLWDNRNICWLMPGTLPDPNRRHMDRVPGGRPVDERHFLWLVFWSQWQDKGGWLCLPLQPHLSRLTWLTN